MLSLRSLSAILCCAALAAAGSRDPFPHTLQLVASSYAVGDAVQSTYHSTSSLHVVVTSDGKLVREFDTVETRTGAKVLRVLAADERGPSRVRVEYGELKSVQHSTDVTGGATGSPGVDDVDERNPLQNRAFTLQRRGANIRVLDENDARVPDGLARLVLEEEGVDGDLYLLAGDRVARELAGRSLPIGVDIPLSKAAARAFVGGREDVGDLRFVVTPRGTRDENGVRVNAFDVSCSIQRIGIRRDAGTTAELSGELLFDSSTGRFHSIRLDGNVTLEWVAGEESVTVEITAQGPRSIHESAHYEHSH